MAKTVRMTGLTGRRFGLEIEMFVNVEKLAAALTAAGIVVVREGYNHETRPHWKLVSDSSVVDPVTNEPYITRNGVRLDSIELVSPILAGEAGLQTIERVCEVLAQLDAQVNIKCGLHVHHGAADLEMHHFLTLARLVNRFERVIDGLMPMSRRKGQNSYCGAFTTEELRTIEEAGRRTAFSTISRYRNLNLCALNRHGTVEFRQHSGTTEVSKIIPWIMLTQGLVEKAKAARVATTQLTDNGDGLDNLLRAAGLRTCRPHHQIVNPAAERRVKVATRYFLARAKEWGVIAVADTSARRGRARRMTAAEAVADETTPATGTPV